MDLILALKVLITFSIGLGVAITLRILALQPSRRPRPAPRKQGTSTHLLIVLGSGGHTAEMIAILRHAVLGRDNNSNPPPSQQIPLKNNSSTRSGAKETAKATPSKSSTELHTGEGHLDWSHYTHRTWVVSSGDTFSASRASDFEAEIAAFLSTSTEAKPQIKGSYTIATVPRARKIHQPLLTTPLSSLQCLWSCIQLLLHQSTPVSGQRPGYPDLILTNGPATATILVLASLVLRFFDVRKADSGGKMRTVYVESWARVKKLSLSGRLLSLVVDRVLVQWVQLEGVQGRGEFLGVLV